MSTPRHKTKSLMCDFMEDDYVARLYHAASKGVDIFGILWRRRGDTGWQFRLRFRYDAGTDDPFDGSDHKSCYAVVHEPEEHDGDVLDIIQAIFDSICRKMNDVRPCRVDDTIVVDAYGRDAFKVFGRQPWVHFSALPEHTGNTGDPKATSHEGDA